MGRVSIAGVIAIEPVVRAFGHDVEQQHLRVLQQRPLERIQVSTLARYELSDAVEIYGEAYYVNTRNRSQLAPDSATPVTPGAGSGTLLVPNYATNPGLSDAVRDFFTNNAAIFDADGDGTAAIVGAGRRYSELGPRQNFFERNAFSLTTGLRGLNVPLREPAEERVRAKPPTSSHMPRSARG